MTKKSAKKINGERFIDLIHQAQQEIKDGKVFTGDLDELAKQLYPEDRKKDHTGYNFK